MAEGDLGRFPVVELRAPREKRKSEITGEKIAKYIEELRGYLRDWDIMPDSFLLVSDYHAGDLRDYKVGEKNKLRTAWFNVISWMRLILRKINLRVPGLELDALEAELRAIKNQEEAVAYQMIAERGIKLPKDPTAVGVVVKRIKKEISPQFLDRKIQLIHRVEKSVLLLIEKLEEELCKVSD